MGKRIEKETLFLRHEFTDAERLDMGASLAAAHNRMADIEEEEASMKASIKERKTQVEATVGSLSRNLGNGFEMRNIPCKIVYDSPNVGEVTYLDPDGKAVKARPMTEAERQMDLPLATEQPPADEKAADASVEKSSAAVDEFFGATSTGATSTVLEAGKQMADLNKDESRGVDEATKAPQSEPIETESSESADTISGGDEPLTVTEAAPLPENFESDVRKSLGAPEPFNGKPRLVDARPGRDGGDTGGKRVIKGGKSK